MIQKDMIYRVCLLLIVIGFLFGFKEYFPALEKISSLKVDFLVEQKRVPVLKGKNNNPVLHLDLRLQEAAILSEIVFEIEGIDLIEDFHLYKTDEKENLSTSNLYSKSLVKNGKFFTVKGDNSLNEGNHYYWAAVKLKDKADLDKKLFISCKYIILNGRKITPNNTLENKPLSLGIKLRNHGDDGVHSFRIPGLATTNKKSLIAVYDIRKESSKDLQGDINVGMSRSTDGGNTWEPMKTIIDMGKWGGKPEKENGVGDPAVLVDRNTNTIWVAALWAHGKPDKATWVTSQPGLKPEETGQLILVNSEDDGKTWSDPINITTQVKDPKWHLLLNGPGKGITMRDGTLVFPAQYKDEEQMPYSTIIFSKDRGKSWHIGTGAKSNTTEAQVVELSDGSLMLNMRDNRGGARSVAVTKDLGKSWTEHPTSRSALPEPVCMASLITHSSSHNGKENDILLFSNPNTTEGRYNITIQASLDDGMTWPEKFNYLLDEEKGWGYSCMTSIDENTIGILYESSQANLVFERVSIEEILE